VSVTVRNIFALTPAATEGEEFLTLFENSSVKIERIVSHSHSSSENYWYDQADDEWVVVLRGTAILEFADGELVTMNPGDSVTIARHVRHRVARTSAETIWLAVHVK
jgi:cupin 2 domain-containing protein